MKFEYSTALPVDSYPLAFSIHLLIFILILIFSPRSQKKVQRSKQMRIRMKMRIRRRKKKEPWGGCLQGSLGLRSRRRSGSAALRALRERYFTIVRRRRRFRSTPTAPKVIIMLVAGSGKSSMLDAVSPFTLSPP